MNDEEWSLFLDDLEAITPAEATDEECWGVDISARYMCECGQTAASETLYFYLGQWYCEDCLRKTVLGN